MKKSANHWFADFSVVAEKEGFEPSIPFWGIHDFQSCALGRTTRLLQTIEMLFNSSLIIIYNIFYKVKKKIARFKKWSLDFGDDIG